MTKSIFRPSRKENGKRIRLRMYRLAYQLPGMAKKKFVSLGTSDKQVAEKKAAELLRELEQERAGVIPAKSLRDEGKKPLCELLESYVRDLRTSGRDSMYCYNVERRLSKLLAGCKWNAVSDITGPTFQAWRDGQELAPKTLRDYQDAMMAFLRWLKEMGLPSTEALNRVRRVETKGRATRNRRAYTLEEVGSLLNVAGDRRLGYLAAFFTGLRRAELAALEWGDVHLSEEPSFIVVRASTSKNHETAKIHLHEQLREALLAARPADADAAAPVLSRDTLASMHMLKKDLAAAGIPYKDAQGRQADFHALRRSLNTHLARAKVDPHTRKAIMRHSDIRLTLDVYTDADKLPVLEAIRCLPSFGEVATLCATNLDISGHQAALAGTNRISVSDSEVPANEQLSHALAPSDTEWHNPSKSCLARTRT